MNRYFIYYNNGEFEASKEINITLIHMVEVGVIKLIVDTKEAKAWTRRQDGTTVKETIHQISGL